MAESKNPFKTENPFQEETLKARKEREEREYLDWLNAAASVDPENKHGGW